MKDLTDFDELDEYNFRKGTKPTLFDLSWGAPEDFVPTEYQLENLDIEGEDDHVA